MQFKYTILKSCWLQDVAEAFELPTYEQRRAGLIEALENYHSVNELPAPSNDDKKAFADYCFGMQLSIINEWKGLLEDILH